MEVIADKGHNEICGGYGYNYTVNFNGTTVKDILEEIKEYVSNSKMSFFNLGDGFGNSKQNCCNAWEITIDNQVYLSSWTGHKVTYAGNLNDKVKNVYGSGGWYCAIDFHIKTF